MTSTVATLDVRQFCVLAPEIVLAAWGLLVLLVDVSLLRTRTNAQRRQATGRLALVGTLAAFATACAALIVRYDLFGLGTVLNFSGIDFSDNPDPVVFFGSISHDLLTETFDLLYILLLALVIWLSMAWSFTEEWGEYFALIFWSTVGMMLLTASEELLTLFLTLETMTICLYLCTSFEKTRRRSAEGGVKYFVYGSVSSALFLFGLSMIYGLTGSTQFDAIRQVLIPTTGGAYTGLQGNIAGATAVLLLLVGFGFKVAAVPFHQWAPDAYEGAPAPVTAWIATGSKMASFVALMKVLLHALRPWASPSGLIVSPGWIGVVVILSAASMTYGNFAALAQRNLKRMLAYSSIAHAGYMLVGVAAAGVSVNHEAAAGSVLYYLVIYAFSNLGAFAVAAWLARDLGSDEIDDLNGLGRQYPLLATCILLLMLSLIGMPPLAGFFGKLYMFMEALNEQGRGHLTLLWLVGLGLLNSVVSAFYYVRVLKAMFLRNPDRGVLSSPSSSIAAPIVLATAVVIGFGVDPEPLVGMMKSAAIPMLSSSGLMGASGLPARIEQATPTFKPPSSPGTSATSPAPAPEAPRSGTPEPSPPAPTPVATPKTR
jgi:NADH-quinone oxidoreductase subunit N